MRLLLARQGCIGLDIGQSSIVGVQVAGRPPVAVLKAYHESPIPEGMVFEGEVVDPVALGAELRAFMKRSHLKGRVVHLGVGNQKVIVRNVEVPDMAEDEIRGALEFQAQDYIPIPVEEAVLDFQVVARQTDDHGVTKQQVLLVAAQKEMIYRFLEAARRADLRVAGIDVSAFALIRALSPTVSFVDQGATSTAFGMVNISSSVSSVVVAFEGVPKFTRIINFAYDNFSRALMEHHGIPVEDAVALTERVGLPGPLEPDTDSYNAVTIEEVHRSLTSVAEELGEEIRRSLDYYHSQDYAASVDYVLLSGRGALLRNLDAFLSDFLNLRVELANPLSKISENQSGTPDETLAAIAPRLAVAVGLALEQVA